MKIERISAEAFRGIANNRSIILDGKSLVIFGDNGTGKSSFVEAIECALTGNVKSLANKGQRVSFKKHSTHVNFAEKDRKAVVSFTLGGITYGPGCAPFKDCELPPTAVEYLAIAQNGTFILRRSALLQFVEATDKDRFNIVKPFLNIERYEDFEAGLKEAKTQTQTELTEAKTKLESTKQVIGQRFNLGSEQVFDTKLRSILQTEAAGIFDKPIASMANVEELKSILQSRISQKGIFATTARTLIADTLTTIPARTVCNDLIEIIEQRLKEETESSKKFLEKVLELGSEWIDSEKLDECPLCEQPIERGIVLSAIRKRLDSNEKLASARRRCDELKNIVATSLEQVVAKAHSIEKAWSDAKSKDEENPVSSLLATCTEILYILRDREYWKQLEKIKEELKVLFEKPTTEVQNQIDSLLGWSAETHKDEHYYSLLEKCNSYISTVPTIFSLVAAVQAANQIHVLANGLYEQTVEVRKRECGSIFREICTEIKTIYDHFHPDEPLGAFTLEVKDRGEGSAVLLGGFADKTEEDPRAYYSEAHQDTLGLAVFLSLYERATRGSRFTLLVLDDILTSVDASHRYRVAEYLLNKVQNGTQLVITTHNRQWFEWLLHIQATKGLKEQFVNKRIIDWSLEEGPILEDPEGDYDVLKASIGQRPHEQVIPIAGRLLEEILHNLRFGLSIAVSAKPGDRYTIGDLFPPFQKKLKDFPALKLALDAVCSELNNTWGVRNWSTHYNDWATELSAAEGKQFMIPVKTLYELVYCDKCRSFVSKSDTDPKIAKCRKACLVYQEQVAAKAEK